MNKPIIKVTETDKDVTLLSVSDMTDINRHCALMELWEVTRSDMEKRSGHELSPEPLAFARRVFFAGATALLGQVRLNDVLSNAQRAERMAMYRDEIETFKELVQANVDADKNSFIFSFECDHPVN